MGIRVESLLSLRETCLVHSFAGLAFNFSASSQLVGEFLSVNGVLVRPLAMPIKCDGGGVIIPLLAIY